eukprot:s1610_g2.t1
MRVPRKIVDFLTVKFWNKVAGHATIIEGFAGRFNFLYVPLCFREKTSLCYAFINFVDLMSLELFRQRHQGLSSIIQYYRNNSVMHPSVPDECKPILLSRSDAYLEEKLQKEGVPVVVTFVL